MPTAPLHPCPGSPSCPHRVRAGMCPQHSLQKEQNRANRDVRKWYYTVRWKRLRQLVIVEQNHRCISCGHAVLELDVDHTIPHRGDPGLFWTRSNLRAMCHSCHARKTGQGQ